MSGLRLLPAESILDTSANVTLLTAAQVVTDHSLLGQVEKLMSQARVSEGWRQKDLHVATFMGS